MMPPRVLASGPKPCGGKYVDLAKPKIGAPIKYNPIIIYLTP